VITYHTTPKESSRTAWSAQLSAQISSTQSVLRLCLGWVAELGIDPSTPYFQKKNLALINAAAFGSLIESPIFLRSRYHPDRLYLDRAIIGGFGTAVELPAYPPGIVLCTANPGDHLWV
jgi:hypothetical protein